MPTSPPNPNSWPSANCVDVLCIAIELFTSFKNFLADFLFCVIIQSVCIVPYLFIWSIASFIFFTDLTETIGDNKIRKVYGKKIKKASIKDWSKEYLAPIVSVKSVKNLNEAINHINKYGTMHTDCIITQNKKSAKKFLKEVKSSIAMHNTSTQFADGGEFGFGGEVGISTSTLPPRGPVGLKQLVSYKYHVTSKGMIRK